MKAIAYNQETWEVKVDEQVPIEEFAEYMAQVYSKATSIPKTVYGDITDLYRLKPSETEADFGIGESILDPTVIASGTIAPSDTHTVGKHMGSEENFKAFAAKLEEICNS